VCVCVCVCVWACGCRPPRGGPGNASTTCCVLVVLLVFSMADACDVANDSPLACDRVVETRSRQGSPHVGVAILPEYSLHKRAQSCAKLSPQCRNVPVGRRLRHCRHTTLYAGTWNGMFVRSCVCVCVV